MRFLRHLLTCGPGATVVAGSVVVAWAVITFLPASWPAGGGTASASSAYQYQYKSLITVNGTGTIQGPSGSVSFDLSAKDDSGVTTGSCTVSEPKTKTKVKCIDVTSCSNCTANPLGGAQAELRGDATVNDVATTFTIDVVDNGRPGVGNDYFLIDTASGYHRAGYLTSGNISIHIQS